MGGGSAMSDPGHDAEARIEALEREVETLRAVNAKLMRERLGRSNTAAAGELLRGETATARLGSDSAEKLAPLRRLRLAIRRVLLRVLR